MNRALNMNTDKGKISKKNPNITKERRWLKLPGFKDWLVFNESPDTVFCKLCSVELRAHLNDLKKHNYSKKHRQFKLQSLQYPEVLIKIEDVTNGIIIQDSGSNYQERIQVNYKLGFIGCGTFTQSMVGGLTTADENPINPESIIISAPTWNNLNKLSPMNITVTVENWYVFSKSEVVFLAVSPDKIAQVLADIPSFDTNNFSMPLFISCITGLSIARLEAMLIHIASSPRVVRISCNTATLVKKSSCFYSMGTYADSNDQNKVESLLSKVGLCRMIPERKMDIFYGMSVAGGLASTYTVIEAMIEEGTALGLTNSEALQFAAQTVIGAGQLVLETKKNPRHLKKDLQRSLHPIDLNMKNEDLFKDFVHTAVDVSTKGCRELN